MTRTRIVSSVVAILAAAAGTPAAVAGAHTWDVIEVFSNASGTIQFIELREMNGTPGETFLSGLKVTSDATGNQYTFPSNLVGPTSNKSILLGTAAYAALPGAVAPDHIIPANFFAVAGDTVRYHVYDVFTFPAVPTNCVNSMNDNAIVAINSPRNYAGQTGSVNCAPPACPSDVTGDHNVNVNDLLAVINSWGACPVPPAACPGDIAPAGGNGTVNVNDLLAVINAWGACP